MRSLCLRRNRGSALILVLIVIGLASLGILGVMNYSKSGLQWSKIFKGKASMEYALESAFELAQSELKDRAERNICGSYDKNSVAHEFPVLSAPYPVEDSATARITFWYTYLPDLRLLPTGSTSVPSITCESATISLPTPVCDMDLDTGPKRYLLCARLENLQTSRVSYVEAQMVAQYQNYSRFALALFNPTTTGNAKMLANQYNGPVHFGQNIVPEFLDSSTPHVFKGPVTFERSSGPFYTHGPNARVEFEKGYVSDHAVRLNPHEVFHGAPATADHGALSGVIDHLSPEVAAWADDTNPEYDSNRLCLLARLDQLERYVCQNSDDVTLSAGTGNSRYQGAPLDSIPIPDKGLVVFTGDRDVSIKGVYSKPMTIATEGTLRIEGDFVNYDGNPQSQVTAGLIANHILIPHYVPNADAMWWEAHANPGSFSTVAGAAGAPLAGFVTYLGATNYVTQSRAQRDYSAEYYGSYAGLGQSEDAFGISVNCAASGACNSPKSLDVDASVFVVDSGLEVEGIDPAAGDFKILAGDPSIGLAQRWIPRNQYYAFGDPVNRPGVPTGKANAFVPKYCGDKDLRINANCDTDPGPPVYPVPAIPPPPASHPPWYLYGAAPRLPVLNLWIYGGLISKDVTFTKLDGCFFLRNGDTAQLVPCGFEKRYLIYNEQLRIFPPPGFPNIPTTESFATLVKRYSK